jgi:hypothetical protein
MGQARQPELYQKVKTLCDTHFGIATQCLLLKQIRTVSFFFKYCS